MQRTIISLVALVALALPATASAASSTAQKHHLDMYKVEQNVVIEAGDYVDDVAVKCDKSDFAVDGMWRIDDVQWNFQLMDGDADGNPWNRYNGVDVTGSFSTSKNGWSFGFNNVSEDAAQLKVWVTCLGNETKPSEGDNHKHAWTLGEKLGGDLPANTLAVKEAKVLQSGKSCGDGEIAVAFGFWVEDGAPVRLFRSWPKDNGQAWEQGFYAPVGAKVHTNNRCLTVKSSAAGARNHKHSLKKRFASFQTWIKNNRVTAVKQDCGDHEKGLLGAFDVRNSSGWNGHYGTHKLWYLGQEPQIKSRVFHIQNSAEWNDHEVKVGAMCFNDRTGPRIR